jgi:tetratricopeptide (TPR) repeat protein
MEVLEKTVANTDRAGLSKRGLASTHFIMGQLSQEAQSWHAVERHYAEAHAILKELYDASPESDKAAGNFALSLTRQAFVQRRLHNDRVAARGMYLEALHIQEDLLAHPKEHRELSPDEIRAQIASTCSGLALDGFADSWQEQESLLYKALELRQEQADATQKRLSREPLSVLHLIIGKRLQSQGQTDDAAKHFEASVALLSELSGESPDVKRYKRKLVEVAVEVGDLYFFRGATERAKQFYSNAVPAAEAVSETNASSFNLDLVAMCYYRVGTAFLRLGNSTDADANYTKCLAVRERQSMLYPNTVKSPLMLTEARCGRHVEAASHAREVRASNPKNVTRLIEVACCYALCRDAVVHGKEAAEVSSEDRDLQVGYLNQAIYTLREAMDYGYRNVGELESEPDLDPIRSAPEFVAILQELKNRTESPVQTKPAE